MKSLQKKEVLSGKMVVWIPSSVLERALLALVAHFQKARKAKARSGPTLTSTYKVVHNFCIPYSNPDPRKSRYLPSFFQSLDRMLLHLVARQEIPSTSIDGGIK